GVVKELKVKVGDKVSVGSPILLLAGAGGAPAEPRATAAAPAPAETQSAKSEPAAPAPETPPPPPTRPVPREPREAVAAKPHASPSVRKFARELGVDLARVPASGPKGRILHEDVQQFVKQAIAGAPAAATARGGALPF